MPSESSVFQYIILLKIWQSFQYIFLLKIWQSSVDSLSPYQFFFFSDIGINIFSLCTYMFFVFFGCSEVSMLSFFYKKLRITSLKLKTVGFSQYLMLLKFFFILWFISQFYFSTFVLISLLKHSFNVRSFFLYLLQALHGIKRTLFKAYVVCRWFENRLELVTASICIHVNSEPLQ